MGGKPRVAFLISGQMRTGALGEGPDALTHPVAALLRRNVFNDALSAEFEHDVFVSVDVANEGRCRDFFGDRLASFERLPDADADPRVRAAVAAGFQLSIAASSFRLQRAWRAMEAFSKVAGEYDIVVRMRPDVDYNTCIVPDLCALRDDPEKQALFAWDLAWAGRPGIMARCCNVIDTLMAPLPTRHDEYDPVFGPYYSGYLGADMAWRVSVPEFQLSECIMRHAAETGMRMRTSIATAAFNVSICAEELKARREGVTR